MEIAGREKGRGGFKRAARLCGFVYIRYYEAAQPAKEESTTTNQKNNPKAIIEIANKDKQSHHRRWAGETQVKASKRGLLTHICLFSLSLRLVLSFLPYFFLSVLLSLSCLLSLSLSCLVLPFLLTFSLSLVFACLLSLSHTLSLALCLSTLY